MDGVPERCLNLNYTRESLLQINIFNILLMLEKPRDPLRYPNDMTDYI